VLASPSKSSSLDPSSHSRLTIQFPLQFQANSSNTEEEELISDIEEDETNSGDRVEDETNTATEEEEEGVNSTARTIVYALPEVIIRQEKEKGMWRICKTITIATSLSFKLHSRMV